MNVVPVRRPSVPIRSGATLTEVLMSLLIMGVGILSSISLFPIAILSSIRATQLTNAKILQENIAEIVRTKPELILGATYWEPGKNYVANQLVIPRPRFGEMTPDSNIYLRAQGAGMSGVIEPNWPRTSGGTVTDNGVTWDVITGSQFVIDPLGRTFTGPLFSDPLLAGEFGNDDNGTSATGTGNGIGVQRVNLEQFLDMTSSARQQLLREFFQLPDSWTVLFEAVPTGVTNTSVTLPAKIDLSGIDSTHRVTVVSLDGTASAQRTVSNYSGNTINLAGANLPAAINSLGEVGLVRVETFNRRYTWMATVNRDANGRTRAQCVIFFNRGFSPHDEFSSVYTGSGSDTLTVTISSTPGPLIREGNYGFDVVTGEWFKIVSATVGSASATVVLDRVIPTAPAGTTTRMVFPPGIVKVFDLEL